MSTIDPMSQPPVDYGSDRYDYIEIDAPAGVTPPPEVIARLDPPCQDCRANLFLRYLGGSGHSPTDPRLWKPTIAHDDSCPTLARIEAGS